jgi:hypothetical protein
MPTARRVVAFAALVGAATAQSCDLAVHADLGDDERGLGTAASPFKTLHRARDTIRALPRPLPPGGLSVCVSPGLYSEPLLLDGPLDSGDDDTRRIVWRGGVEGLGGASSSSSSPSSWPRTELTGGVRVPFTPDPTTPGLWVSDLAAANVTDLGTRTPHGFLVPPTIYAETCTLAPLELFFDGSGAGGPGSPGYGRPLTVARWPNAADPLALESMWRNESSWTRAQFVRGFDTMPTTIFTDPNDVPFETWSDSFAKNLVWLGGYLFYDWADAVIPVLNYTRYNSSQGQLVVPPSLLPYNITFSAKYYLEGAPEALDAPGEYIVDAETRTVRLLPPPDADTGSGTLYGWVSVNETAVAARDVAFVTLANITISFTRGTAASITGNGVSVVNVTVVGAGTGSISVDGGNMTVLGCTVLYAGGGGISSGGGGDRATLTPSGNALVDNTVAYVGRRCLAYSPALSVGGVGAVIAHNRVSFTPHMGMTAGVNNALVEYNVVTDCVLAACDMGALYEGATDWSVRGGVVRYNLFARNGFSGTGCNMQSGSDVADVYVDSAMSGVASYGNVHWSPLPVNDGPRYISKARETYSYIYNGGTGVSAENALILDANISFTQSCDTLRGMFTQACNASDSRIAGMLAMKYNTGVYAEAYPDLARLQAGCEATPAACAVDPTCPAAPYGTVFATSAIVNSSAGVVIKYNGTGFPATAANITNLFTANTTDGLGFVSSDPRGTLNFQLQNDSVIYSAVPGFQRIPMECFGPFACDGIERPYPRASRGV